MGLLEQEAEAEVEVAALTEEEDDIDEVVAAAAADDDDKRRSRRRSFCGGRGAVSSRPRPRCAAPLSK